MKILLKGVHATSNATLLRDKLAIAADIVPCLGDEPEAEIAAAFADAEAAVAMHWRAPLPPAPALRLLQLPGAGSDGIDFSLLPKGCRVCNVYEHETGIAEYVMLSILEWAIRGREMDAAFKAGSWRHSLIRMGQKHGEIAGKTLALVGYGHIGHAVAARANAFAMRVVAVTRTPPAHDPLLAAAHRPQRLDAVLAECDVLVLACPLTAATRGMIGAAQLAALKPSALLINVARAALVDEEALYQALAARRIVAALDVWYAYPEAGGPDVRPSRFPFHELDNVVMTPHAAGWTEDMFERRWSKYYL